MSNAVQTQYNPNHEFNETLLAAGASKTVYALVTPQTENAKQAVFLDNYTLEQCREAWSGKQDVYHMSFFDAWHEWARPVVDLDRLEFPFYYPTNGASEALRHIIYDHAANGGTSIHVFEGEYEGYRAMAEAAGLKVVEHKRYDDDPDTLLLPHGQYASRTFYKMDNGSLFFISQPSAIDGNVWPHFNEFISKMRKNSVVVDLTYVGAVPKSAVTERFDMNQKAIRNVVFSLSKPFGVYYDRIGGVFARKEDGGLFGNKWFKNLTSLRIGLRLLQRHDVFYMPNMYGYYQEQAAEHVGKAFGFQLKPSDVYMLATGTGESELADYVRRGENGLLRLCLTPHMAQTIGTVGAIS